MELTLEQIASALNLADLSYLITPSKENKEKLKTKITIVKGQIPGLMYEGLIMYLTDNPEKGAIPLELTNIDV